MMQGVFDSLLAWLHAMGEATNSPVVLLLLAAAAATEYIIPPFPGDSVTLLGGILVSAFHWSFLLVFAAVMVGSVLGSLVAFALGKRLASRQPKLREGEGRLARLIAQFDKRGTWFLLINRFLPGIRPLFFVAAGMAGMSTRRVALLSAISAALWNLAIMAAGAVVGDNLERLESLLLTYSKFAWGLIALAVLLLVLRRRFRRSPPAP